MAPPQGVHVPLRFLRAMIKKGSSIIRNRVLGQPSSSKPVFSELAPIYARINPQPTQNAASYVRQRIGKRWYTTRSFFNTFVHDSATAAKHGFKKPTYRPVTQSFRTATPFATVLRPRLHGGAMPRTAGGYSIGGGARFFSHSPTPPAQVIQQVSQAVRGFILGGGGKYESYKRSDGSIGRLGVRALLAANLAQGNAPGAYVDFNLAPSFTALSPLNPQSLENAEFMQGLAADFGSMIAEITAVHGDMQRLAMLGDLPISIVAENGHTLRVHFPGCDREFVEKICEELGVRRGIVHEDERFAFGASILDLGMMYAPQHKGVEWRDMLSEESCSNWSDDGQEDYYVPKGLSNVTRSFDDDVRSLDGEEYFSHGSAEYLSSHSDGMLRSADEFEGLEGIYNFLYQPQMASSRRVRV